MMESPKPRIYVHSPLDWRLPPPRKQTKTAILFQLISVGFDPQEFNASGIPLGMNWTFDTAAGVMDRCQGAVIIALPKYDFLSPLLSMPSEYAHFEGALALSRKLPTLIIAETGAQNAGITSMSGGLYINHVPSDDALQKQTTGSSYFDSPSFKGVFDTWAADVRSHSKVFFGYCSKAQSTADAIIKYLIKSLGVDVVDWAVDFGIGSTIMGEIGSAIGACRCGIFLFTRDDPLEGDAQHAAPRDNVIFETGYCLSTRGPQRTIIIREEGAKMPADLGGSIYISLKDRADITSIQERLRTALLKAM